MSNGKMYLVPKPFRVYRSKGRKGRIKGFGLEEVQGWQKARKIAKRYGAQPIISPAFEMNAKETALFLTEVIRKFKERGLRMLIKVEVRAHD